MAKEYKDYYKRVDCSVYNGWGYRYFNREEYLAWRRRMRNSNFPLTLINRSGREFTFNSLTELLWRFRTHTIDKRNYDWTLTYYANSRNTIMGGRVHDGFPVFEDELRESENVIS